jgi:LPXTG-motif cell wall-anchored protein
MFKKSLAIFALAAVSFLTFAAPANAVDPYPPAGPCAMVSGTPAQGATITVTFTDGCFAPSEQYDVTVTGAGTITLDGVVAVSVRKTATSTGAGSIQVTLPQDAAGAYVVTGVGVASQRSCSVTLDVASSSPAIVIPPAATTSTTPTASLANTGYEAPTLALLSAGGLVLIGAAIVIGLTRRTRSGAK